MKKIVLLFSAAFAGLTFSQNALNFDGIDDYVHTSYAGVSGAQSRTIEAWINTSTSTADAHYITDYGYFGTSSLDNGKRFTLLLTNTHQFRVEIRGWGLNATTALNDGVWHHVAATFDGTTVRLYVDGVEEAFGDPTITVNTTLTTPLLIGSRTDLLDLKNFEGNIDEVKFWDVVRTPQEIAQFKDYEFCTAPSNLVAYYKLNEGTVGADNSAITTIADASVNSNDGTITDFTMNGATSNFVSGAPMLTSFTSNQTLNICAEDSVIVGTNVYKVTGNYSDILTSVLTGCDSTVNTDLTMKAMNTASQTLVECPGFSITIGTNTYNATGIYTDTLTSVLDGCDSILTTDLTITTLDNTTSVSGITISATESGATYKWADCDNNYALIAGETSQDFTPTANGNYAVIIDNGCEIDTSDCVAITTVGIEETNMNSFMIFPNPAVNELNINMNNENSTYTFAIKNIAGQTIIYNENNMGDISVNTSDLTTGLYFIEIQQEGLTTTLKFIKK
ncbi:MAG: T9SS type A sorting domain-containing protein [Crocinitomicaceae bacterium]|nr:T9SS type A sorting domain-containing protein [Crocinitomicaceae bacterium]